MNSPLVLTAGILWLLLIGLVARQCQRWAKERNRPVIIEQNHPAIPVKVYQLSDFAEEPKPTHKPVTRKTTLEQSVSPNAWDV